MVGGGFAKLRVSGWGGDGFRRLRGCGGRSSIDKFWGQPVYSRNSQAMALLTARATSGDGSQRLGVPDFRVAVTGPRLGIDFLRPRVPFLRRRP